MKDENKTKDQPINELVELRQRIAELETSETERKRAEEALRESEEKYRNIVETAPDGIVTVSLKGIVTSCNSAFINITGFSKNEIVGKHFSKLPTLRARDIPKYMKLFNSLIRGKVPRPFEVRWLHKDGTVHWAEVRVSLMKKGRKIIGLQAIERDITERKRAEEEIRKLSQFLDSVIDNANVWLDVLDEKANVVIWNRAAEEISGYSREEVVGHGKIWEWLYPDEEYRNKVFAEATAIIERGEVVEDFETTIRRKDGQTRIISWNSRNLVDEKGNSIGSIALGRDITERKRAEEALQESEERFRSLFENSTIGLYRTTPDGRILLVNPTLVRMLGYSSFDELARRNLEEEGFEPDYRRSQFRERMEREGEVKGLEAAWRRRDGSVIFVRESAKAIRGPDGTALYYEGTVEDITERKRAEEALRESEEKYRNIVEMAPDGIVTVNLKGTITSCNSAFTNITGFSNSEIVGKHFSKVPTLRARDIPKYIKVFNSFIKGKVPKPFEIRWLHKDGTAHWAEIRVSLMKKGRKIIGLQAIARDVTERKRAEEALKEYSERLEEMVEERTKELRDAQEELVRKEKLAVLGQLAGGVGHELRNPLGVISNAVYYLQIILPDADEATKEYLEMISSEVHHSEKIVSDLLDFSRSKPADREEIAVPDLVAQLLERQPPPEDVKVTTRIASDLPLVFVDPRQIGQVLVNLVTNAYEAMPEGGRLTIKAEGEKDRVYLSITDTGCGIPQENVERLFEPLFTTKARGIGLGLAVSKNLVEANGGSIEVKSPSTEFIPSEAEGLRTGKEGQGSTFTIILPTKEVQS